MKKMTIPYVAKEAQALTANTLFLILTAFSVLLVLIVAVRWSVREVTYISTSDQTINPFIATLSAAAAANSPSISVNWTNSITLTPKQRNSQFIIIDPIASLSGNKNNAINYAVVLPNASLLHEGDFYVISLEQAVQKAYYALINVIEDGGAFTSGSFNYGVFSLVSLPNTTYPGATGTYNLSYLRARFQVLKIGGVNTWGCFGGFSDNDTP